MRFVLVTLLISASLAVAVPVLVSLASADYAGLTVQGAMLMMEANQSQEEALSLCQNDCTHAGDGGSAFHCMVRCLEA